MFIVDVMVLASVFYLLSDRGTDIITPFPVPIQSLLQEIIKDVIRTNEKPSLPVPEDIKSFCMLY